MLEDYKKAVIFHYHQKKKLLSSNLTHPTPGKLRDECLDILRSRYDDKDKPFIKSFFNSTNDSNDYSHSIKRFDADRFRPLVKFMKGQIEDTADKNVELLAWLIDFEYRPYRYGIDYSVYISLDEQKDLVFAEEQREVVVVPPRVSQNAQERKAETKRTFIGRINTKIAAIVAAPLLLFSAAYLYTDSNKAYICNQGTGTKYHLSNKCPALENCRNSFVSTSISNAEKNGKSLCGFEK